MDFNNISNGYFYLNSWKFEIAQSIFESLYLELSKEDFKIDSKYMDNYISICKWLWEINLRNNDFNKAIDNYLFIYNKISDSDFDTLATLWQMYQNIWNDEKKDFFLKKAQLINHNMFKDRFWLWIEYIWRRVDNNDNLYIYIISKCAFNCCFCDRWENSFKENIKFETTLDEIKNIIKNTDLSKINTISIWWNEPLTNLNIISILNFLDTLWININLYTSWSEFHKTYKLLNIKNLRKVFLPIYWSNHKIHDEIVWKQWSYNNLHLINKILSNWWIEVFFSKLLVEKNFYDDNYIKPWEFFWTLHPKSTELYYNNSVQLSQILKKIDFSSKQYFEIVKLNTIPLCTYLNLISNEDLFLINIKNDYNEIKNSKINQNIIENYTKLKKCNNCVISKYCLWYYKQYFEKYWDNEINPITKLR